MPDILSPYAGDAYTMLSLLRKLEKIPTNPGRIYQEFVLEGITTTTALLEIENQSICILGTSPRGSSTPTKGKPDKHERVVFEVPHIEDTDSISADSLLGIRALGSDQPEPKDVVLSKKMERMKRNMMATFERHAAYAIQGQVLDSDDSVLFDLWTLLGETETTVQFQLSTGTTDVRAKCVSVTRAIRDGLKGVPHSGVVGLCGRNFLDSFVGHAEVKETYKYQQGLQNRANLDKDGVVFGGISFELYDEYVGNTPYINTDHCRFFPTGVPELFKHIAAPSDRYEAGVGTIGQQMYFWQQDMDDKKGTKVTMQANPAIVCTRPKVLVKGVKNT